MTRRWRHRPPGSNWGDFGPDDELGRLNLITPRKVLEGAAEIREGRAFCLSLPLDVPGGAKLNPRRHPPRLAATVRDGKPQWNFPLDRVNPAFIDVLNDDEATLCLQYSTQWDSLCHCGARFDADGDGIAEFVYYNGFRANEHVRGPHDYAQPGDPPLAGPYGARALGVDRMAEKAIQGRAVLVDLHAHFGRARKVVGYDDWMRVLEADRVVVEPGDMLVIHTGYAAVLLGMNRDPDPAVLHNSCAALDGADDRLLDWITQSGVAAICADNDAVEVFPARTRSVERYAGIPLHHHCLFKLGVPLAELWWLTDLAGYLRKHGRNRFLLTAPPLRLPGAVGSPVTPVATV